MSFSYRYIYIYMYIYIYIDIYVCIYIYIIWLRVEPTPFEKYEFVSWDDEIPNLMEK